MFNSFVNCQTSDAQSHSSNIPEYLHGAAGSHCPPEHYNLVLNSGTVDRDHAAICTFDLDTWCVDIELAKDNLIHIVLPKAKIIRTLLLLR